MKSILCKYRKFDVISKDLLFSKNPHGKAPRNIKGCKDCSCDSRLQVPLGYSSTSTCFVVLTAVGEEKCIIMETEYSLGTVIVDFNLMVIDDLTCAWLDVQLCDRILQS